MPRLRYLALVAAAACSPVKDASNVPDAPIDAPDMKPPMIASSVPEDMGSKVSVLSPISVYFDEPLDPASVSNATVKLGYVQPNPPPVFPDFIVLISIGPVPAGLVPIKGTVSYDEAAKKVSFVPALPLPYGRAFTLSLDVKDRAGLAFTGQLHFRTYVNANTKQFLFNTLGEPVGWIGNPTDMAGWPSKHIEGNAPGNDTIWFTADDPRNQHFDFNYRPDGRLVDERYYAPGPDGRFDTPDDTISLCATYRYSADGKLEERTYADSAGPDAMWCTDDDTPVDSAVFTYDGAKLTGFILNVDEGTDNTWHTSDDICTSYLDYEYDAQGTNTREIYRTCGPDGFSRTPDDSVYYYVQYESDAEGNLTRVTRFYDPGPDTQWFTADDPPSLVTRYMRDGDGQVIETRFSYDDGADMMWGTDDDLGERTTQTYNAQKLVDEVTTYAGFGTDGVWGTADDEIQSYSRFMYDANGNRIDEKEYHFGPDGMWKTADDRVTIDYEFELGK